MANKPKYLPITQRELTDLFLFMKSHGADERDVKQVSTLMNFMMEYNVNRPFTQTHMTGVDEKSKKKILIKLDRPKYFWPCQNGSCNKYPWQPKMKSIKIHEDHWIVNSEARMKLLKITAA